MSNMSHPWVRLEAGLAELGVSGGTFDQLVSLSQAPARNEEEEKQNNLVYTKAVEAHLAARAQGGDKRVVKDLKEKLEKFLEARCTRLLAWR